MNASTTPSTPTHKAVSFARMLVLAQRRFRERHRQQVPTPAQL